MANKKFTDLDPAGANPTLVDSDIMAVTLDPAGTPVSRKTSISNLMTKAPVQSVAGRTGAVTLSDTDISGLGTAATTASTDYATSAQGALADTAVQPSDGISTLTNDSGYITGLSAGALSDFDFDDNAILGFSASVDTPTITANAITLTDADNGKVLALDNGATAMTVNINTGLQSGFNCSFIQIGTGQVTFAGSATVNNRQSHTKINGQYGVASVVGYTLNTYILAGDTAA